MLLWDASLRWHGVSAPLLLGDVVLICKSLLLLDGLGHVAWVHLRVALWHTGARLLRGEVLRAGLLGRLDWAGIVNAVLAAAGRFGSIEACLERGDVSSARRDGREPVRAVCAYLDEVLALSLGDQGLELGGGEGVDQTGLRDDEQEDLRAGEDRQFVCLGRWLATIRWHCDDATRRRRGTIEERGEEGHKPSS